MTEPLPGPDELIDKAARPLAENALRRYGSEYNADHLSANDFMDDAREDVRALLDRQLLADPGLQAELEQEIADLKQEHGLLSGRLESVTAELEQWIRIARERNVAAREVANLRDEVATARQETEDVRESHGLVVSDRDELSIKLEDVTIALQGDADFKPVLVNPAVDQIQALRAERDQLQARVDAATAELKKWDALATRESEWMPCRAGLAALQPSPPLPVSGEQAEAVPGD